MSVVTCLPSFPVLRKVVGNGRLEWTDGPTDELHHSCVKFCDTL